MSQGKGVDLVKRLFSRGEAFDAAGFATRFTERPLYQFGNSPLCLDRPAIEASANAFFAQITAVYHEIKVMEEVGDTIFVEMDVHYWRLDNSHIALPCADIFRREGELFTELRIFMDVNPVADAGIRVDRNVSVFTLPGGGWTAPGSIMRRHFVEHPEGRERARGGFPPRWSIDGPRWPLDPHELGGSDVGGRSSSEAA